MGKRDELESAYQRLDIEEYKGIVKQTCIPIFDEYDREFVTVLFPETTLSIKPHYCDGKFMGYNIYGDEILLETKSSIQKARKYMHKICQG